jgi:hypothetical protein
LSPKLLQSGSNHLSTMPILLPRRQAPTETTHTQQSSNTSATAPIAEFRKMLAVILIFQRKKRNCPRRAKATSFTFAVYDKAYPVANRIILPSVPAQAFLQLTGNPSTQYKPLRFRSQDAQCLQCSPWTCGSSL